MRANVASDVPAAPTGQITYLISCTLLRYAAKLPVYTFRCIKEPFAFASPVNVMKSLLIFLTCAFLLVYSLSGQTARKIDLEKKIKEATPPELPQSPVGKWPSTDARDEGLKGNVKSLIEYTQGAGSRKRLLEKASYYDKTGYLTKSILYDEGYPSHVLVYGFLDGMRVNRSTEIIYADGEKPASKHQLITVRAEDNAKDPNAPRDTRYRMRDVREYDSQGRLIEGRGYQNNGELWQRTTYIYEGNHRTEREFDRDGNEFTKTTYLLDASGNELELLMHADENEPPEKYLKKYEFDSLGNWIVERTYEETVARKRKIVKLAWTSYRTITYHP